MFGGDDDDDDDPPPPPILKHEKRGNIGRRKTSFSHAYPTNKKFHFHCRLSVPHILVDEKKKSSIVRKTASALFLLANTQSLTWQGRRCFDDRKKHVGIGLKLCSEAGMVNDGVLVGAQNVPNVVQ